MKNKKPGYLQKLTKEKFITYKVGQKVLLYKSQGYWTKRLLV